MIEPSERQRQKTVSMPRRSRALRVPTRTYVADSRRTVALLTSRCGIGFVWKRRRHGLASHFASLVARLLRALSVAIPVFAYICRYSFEIKTSISRDLNEVAQLDRFQIEARL